MPPYWSTWTPLQGYSDTLDIFRWTDGVSTGTVFNLYGSSLTPLSHPLTDYVSFLIPSSHGTQPPLSATTPRTHTSSIAKSKWVTLNVAPYTSCYNVSYSNEKSKNENNYSSRQFFRYFQNIFFQISKFRILPPLCWVWETTAVTDMLYWHYCQLISVCCVPFIIQLFMYECIPSYNCQILTPASLGFCKTSYYIPNIRDSSD